MQASHMLLHVFLTKKMWDYVHTLSNWTPCVFCDSCVRALVVHLFISCLPSAPIDNLRLFKKLHTYKMMNQKITDVAITFFNRHPWYLCEEYVPILLLNDKVNDMEKKALVSSLKLCEHSPTSFPMKRHGGTFGKSVFPVHNITTTLASVIDPDFWYFLTSSTL